MVILILLSIMLIYSLAAAQSVLRLKEEIRHFEKKQIERLRHPTSRTSLSRHAVPEYKFDTHHSPT
ncbi:MAG: hypothetical protein HYR88_04010 [Verrucomicrobia bacterium]|nr:hypothetical protein [Verrucomicrobiota bacterium]